MRSTVLCYNLKGTKKGKQISMIFGFLGFKVRHIEKEEYLYPLGMLAGSQQLDTDKDVPTYTGEGFSDEMLLLHSETEDILDKAIFLMRKDKVQVALKAILTPMNQEWTSIALHDEILKEHLYMTQQAEERK